MSDVSPHHYLENADLLYDELEIKQAIESLAKLIGKECSEDIPVVLTVMNGALVFAGQLIPYLNFPLELDYIHATRYEDGIEGRRITWLAKPKINLSGRNVIILDDILDQGITLKTIVEACYAEGARKVKTAVLLEKDLPEEKPIAADFVGLKAPNHYVFGFGMDIYGLWRNLPVIYGLNST